MGTIQLSLEKKSVRVKNDNRRVRSTYEYYLITLFGHNIILFKRLSFIARNYIILHII